MAGAGGHHSLHATSLEPRTRLAEPGRTFPQYRAIRFDRAPSSPCRRDRYWAVYVDPGRHAAPCRTTRQAASRQLGGTSSWTGTVPYRRRQANVAHRVGTAPSRLRQDSDQHGLASASGGPMHFQQAFGHPKGSHGFRRSQTVEIVADKRLGRRLAHARTYGGVPDIGDPASRHRRGSATLPPTAAHRG